MTPTRLLAVLSALVFAGAAPLAAQIPGVRPAAPPPGGRIGPPPGGRITPTPVPRPAPNGGPGCDVPGVSFPDSSGYAPATPGTISLTPSAPLSAARPSNECAPAYVCSAEFLATPVTGWETWWAFNKAPYLDFYTRTAAIAITPGDGELLLGMHGGVAYATGGRQPGRTTLRATETLLATLAEDDLALQNGALRSLARADGDSAAALERYRPWLAKNGELGETAVLALGFLDGPDAMQALLGLLRDDAGGRVLAGSESGVPVRKRVFAAYALGLLGERLEHDAVREWLSHSLWTALREERGAYVDVPAAAAIALGKVALRSPEALAEEMLGYLNDPDADRLVAAHLANSLGRLMRASEDRQMLRRCGIDLVRHLGDKQAPAELRQSAAQALGMLARPGIPETELAVAALIRAAQADADVQVRHFAIMALAYAGAELGPASTLTTGSVLPFLIDRLRGTKQERPWAGLALGVMAARGERDGRTVVPMLAARHVHQAFQRSRDVTERGAYAIALGLLRHQQAAADLLAAMNDGGSPDLREHCAIGLGLMGARESGESLHALLAEGGALPQILEAAGTALALLGDPQAVPALAAALRRPDGRAATLPTIEAAAAAFATIGDRRAAEPLLDLIADGKALAQARGRAGAALGEVLDTNGLPARARLATDLNYMASFFTLLDPLRGSGVLDRL
ncbi:MAG TPA: hypothetical protein VGC54_05645 [Planctomycetota bacterium]